MRYHNVIEHSPQLRTHFRRSGPGSSRFMHLQAISERPPNVLTLVYDWEKTPPTRRSAPSVIRP
jgi:hypothetical protein